MSPKEKAIVKEAADRCEFRRTEEAKAAVQTLQVGKDLIGKTDNVKLILT